MADTTDITQRSTPAAASMLVLDPRHALCEEATAWLPFLGHVLSSHRRDWFDGLDLAKAAKPDRPVSVRGSYDSAPIAAAVIERISGVPSALELGVAAAVVATLMRRPGFLSDAKYAELLVAAGRGMRQLGTYKGKELARVTGAATPAGVARMLEGFSDGRAADPREQLLRRYMGDIARALKLAAKWEAPAAVVTPVSPAIRARPAIPALPRRVTRDDVCAREAPRIPGIELTTKTTPADAGAPAEDQADSPVKLPRHLPGSDRVASRPHRLTLDKLELRAIQRSAQGLSFDRINAITRGAVADLGIAFDAAACGDAPSPVAALGFLSLYSGNVAKDVAAWPVFASEPKAFPAGPFICAAPQGVFLPVVAAPMLDEPPDTPALSRPISTHHFLPIPPWVAGGECILKVLRTHPENAPLANAESVAELGKLLKQRAMTTGNPVTPRRLASAAALVLAQEGMGAAEIALVSHDTISDFGRTPLFYYCPAAAHVSLRSYRGACRLSRWLGTDVAWPSGAAQVRRGYIGDPRCPTHAAVKARLAELKDFDLSRPTGRSPDARFADHHNRFQAWCHQVFLWLTGVRPFDHALDAMFFSDDRLLADEKAKPGTADRATSAARVIPLAQVVRNVIRPMWLDQRARAVARFENAFRAEPFFLLDPRGGVLGSSVATMRALLPPTQLRANAHRHYFRTELDHLDLPLPTLNRWMGHWGLGRELGLKVSGQAPGGVTANDISILEAFAASLCLAK